MGTSPLGGIYAKNNWIKEDGYATIASIPVGIWSLYAINSFSDSPANTDASGLCIKWKIDSGTSNIITVLINCQDSDSNKGIYVRFKTGNWIHL